MFLISPDRIVTYCQALNYIFISVDHWHRGSVADLNWNGHDFLKPTVGVRRVPSLCVTQSREVFRFTAQKLFPTDA